MARNPSPPDVTAKPGVSRRLFLKTAGAGAAVSGLAPGGAEAAPVVLGPGPVPISLRVNGATTHRDRRATDDAALGRSAGSPGPHGIQTGLRPRILRRMHRAARRRAGARVHDARGRRGGARGHHHRGPRHAGEDESAAEGHSSTTDALQCGFCTPGFVVAGTALSKKNPNPTLDEIKHGLEGNLCRCGTYSRIFEAVQKAAKEMKAARG